MGGRTEAGEIRQLRTRLLLERAVDRRLDRLLRAAGRQVYLLRDDRTMRENQIRNVLEVALSKPSIDVVTNFIRYQMGRSGGNQAWLHNNFGQKVVEDIERGIVPELAAEVAEEVSREVPEADRDEVAREARLRLVRLYLGYLNRWFYYGFKTRRWDDIAAATKEACTDV